MQLLRSALIAKAVDSAYEEADEAVLVRTKRFLAWTAYQMENREGGSRNLQWWRIRRWAVPWSTPILSAAMFASTAAAVVACAGHPAVGLVVGFSWFIAAGCTGGLLTGIGAARNLYFAMGVIPRVMAGVCLGSSAINIAVLKSLIDGRLTNLYVLSGLTAVGGLSQGIAGGVVALHDTPLLSALRRPSRMDLATGLIAGLVALVVVGSVAGMSAGIGVAIVGFVGGVVCLTAARPADRPVEQVTPTTSFLEDIRGGVIFAVLGAISIGTAVYLALLSSVLPARTNMEVSALSGLGCGLAAFFLASHGAALWITALYLDARGVAPARIMGTLRDAWDRQLLRQVGAVYQFRHGDIQEHLAHEYAAQPG